MDEFKNLEDQSNEENKEGYTLTGEGGFYTKSPENVDKYEPAADSKGSFVLGNENNAIMSDKEEYTPPVFVSYPSYDNDFATKTKVKDKEKKGVSVATVIISVILSALVGMGGGIAGFLALNELEPDNSFLAGEQADGENNSQININVQNLEATIGEAVAEKVTPSVVGIRTTVSVSNFFGGTQEASGEGSGVIYTADGYIITNYHVISDAIDYGKSSEIQVFLSSDATKGYAATIVGYNISNDLAVVKINGKNLPVIEWADSDSLKVGQQVMAVGNPGGLEFMGSATWGIISGLNRVISSSSDGSTTELIQTDAAINPGNSGGALVNTEGKLVGINSSKLVSESIEGMGFAIPSNTVKEICDKIIAKENNPDPYLGITISTRYDPETLQNWGYPVGAVVYSVAVDSPADDAGIEKGDIITEFNGQEITHYDLLSQYLEKCKPGDNVSIQIYRSGRYLDGTVTIGSNNSQ